MILESWLTWNSQYSPASVLRLKIGTITREVKVSWDCRNVSNSVPEGANTFAISRISLYFPRKKNFKILWACRITLRNLVRRILRFWIKRRNTIKGGNIHQLMRDNILYSNALLDTLDKKKEGFIRKVMIIILWQT